MSVKIGIIEDDAALREGLVMAFELEGYETASAGSFREGQTLLETGGLDAVILDCNLPGGSGYWPSGGVSIFPLTGACPE